MAATHLNPFKGRSAPSEATNVPSLFTIRLITWSRGNTWVLGINFSGALSIVSHPYKRVSSIGLCLEHETLLQNIRAVTNWKDTLLIWSCTKAEAWFVVNNFTIVMDGKLLVWIFIIALSSSKLCFVGILNGNNASLWFIVDNNALLSDTTLRSKHSGCIATGIAHTLPGSHACIRLWIIEGNTILSHTKVICARFRCVDWELLVEITSYTFLVLSIASFSPDRIIISIT